MRQIGILTLGFFLLPVFGCSQGEPTPDQALQAIAVGATENKPQVYWESLPPSYQRDVDGLVKEFAGKMDAEIWDSGFGVAQKAVKVLKEKKEYILANPFVAMAGVEPATLDKNWDSVVAALSALVNSDVSKIERLKKLDVQEFLSTTGADIMQHASSVAEAVPQANIKEQMANFKNAKFSVVKMDGDVATVKIDTPNLEPGQKDEVQLVKVEGKWILKDIADNWSEKMKEARQALADFDPDQIKENKEQIMAQIKVVDTQLNLLLSSKSADDFNGKLMAMAMMFGGGGGPPAGFDGGLSPESFSPGSFDDEAVPADDSLPGFNLTPDEAPFETDAVPSEQE